jgi:hypothetical protein
VIRVPLPNLFSGPLKSKDSRRLYDLFLARLSQAGQGNRIVTACRIIRRMARRAGRPQAAAFTFFWEIEGHGVNRDFEAMWRTLRAWEIASTGRRLNIRTHRWTQKEHHQLIFRYAPLLYMRGRYRLGCRLMETALEMASHRKGWSFDWLWHVYKPMNKPASTYDVTLSHFYRALGRDLTEWKLWAEFLDDLDPRLFRLSGVVQEAMLVNPRLLKKLFEWITLERRKRLFTGTTDGLRDLIEAPGKVQRRQSARGRQIMRVVEQPGLDAFEQRFRELFPELNELPRQLSPRSYFRRRLRGHA